MFGRVERRRWLRALTVVAPVAAVVLGLEVLSDTLLDTWLPFPRDAIVVSLVALVLGTAVAILGLRRIDALNREIAARNDELEARNAAASALHRVSSSIAALNDIDAIVGAITDQARALLHADVAVLLLNGPDGLPRLRAASGRAAGLHRAGDLPAEDDLRRFVAPDHLVSHLVAPLQRGGNALGILAIGAARARTFDIDDVETLASLANQATIALENARLEARLRELAVVAERERIARELHDGISQVLGYVNTKSQAIDELLAAGRVGEARTHLGQLAAAARSVYVDVREAILGLRNPISTKDGLVTAIEAHAAAVADAAKLAVAVEATPAGRAAQLAPEAEVQVFRVVQEALTNVRKHAGAHRVVIAVDLVADRLRVVVRDDGRGLAGAPPPTVRATGCVRCASARRASVATLPGRPRRRAVRWSAARFRWRSAWAPRASRQRDEDPARRRSSALPRRGGLAARGLGSRGGGRRTRRDDRGRPRRGARARRRPHGCGDAGWGRSRGHPPDRSRAARHRDRDAHRERGRGRPVRGHQGRRARLSPEEPRGTRAAPDAGRRRSRRGRDHARDGGPDPRRARPAGPAERAGGGAPDRLTDRERDVLRLVVAGMRNKEIAAELGISENTTKFHLRNILEKLHAESRAEVAARAVRDHLVDDA